MKRFASLCLLSALLAFSPGCATLTPEQKADNMASIANIAAYTGASLDLIQNPEHRLAYEAVVAGIDLLLRENDYSPGKFVALMQQLPVKELAGPKGLIIVTSAVMLWDNYARQTVNLDRSVYVAPVMRAVRAGLFSAMHQL